MIRSMPDSRETGPHSSGAHETMSDDAPVRRTLHLERGSALGRYVVLEPIGAGGMSIVYAAYDPELDRKVALKVLRGVSDPDSPMHTRERMRLLREAQAMARLTHPNVVPIYDAGSIGDRVFLAMHYVEGQTLTRWLAQDRTWREIVEFFVYAGRGLAAAHDAGLVHRDFKPDNVLVDRDGRVRVTDFGLARPSEVPRSSEGDEPADAKVVRGPVSLTSSARLDRPVTLAGAILGTPAYMSPEQHLALEVDARTDQFSFCVALWEALVGERPFAGSTVGELAFAVTRGQIRTFPRESAVPARIRRALARGLSRTPTDRFSTMEALLRELAPRSRARPLLFAGTALALVGLGAGLSSLTAAPEDPCAAARAGLDPIYGPSVREELVQSVVATGGLGPEVTETLARLLDRHAEQWREVATESCVAHHIDATASAELFDARMRCLGRRRVDFEANLAQLREADEERVGPVASRVFDAVSPIECQDDARLLEAAPPPDDPTLRALAVRVEKDIDEMLGNVSSDDEALARAIALVRDADATGWQGLVARARALQALIHEARGEIPQTEALLRDAARAAALGHERGRMLFVLGDLAYTLAYLENRVPEALEVVYLLELELARGGTPSAAPGIYSSMGTVYQGAGQVDRAEEVYRKALALMDAAEFDNPFRRTVLTNNLGTIALARGDALAARESFEQALALSTRAFGPEYPRNSDNYVNLCESFLLRGELDLAKPRCERALALVDGPRPRDVAAAARALHTLAALALSTGDLAEARASMERGRPLVEAAFGANSYAVVSLEGMEITARILERDLDGAAARLAALDATLTPTPSTPLALRALVEMLHGELALAEGDAKAALARFEAATAATEAPEDHPDRVMLLANRGTALARLGRAVEATPLLVRALEIHGAKGGDPYSAARAGFELAKLRAADDPADARRLAVAAQRDLTLVRRRDPRFATEVDGWLEAHP
jgi:tetratricopeptide (TPR) repeat protein